MPLALDQAYSYRVPAGMTLAPGDFVNVSLGQAEYTGVVWGEGNPRPGLHNRLKDIGDKLDVPPLRQPLRDFVDWVSGYTLGARGMVMRMTMRMGENLGPGRERVGVRLAGPPPKRMTPARSRVLRLFEDGLTRAKADAAHEAGVSTAVINGLIDEGTLETIVLPPDPIAELPDPDFMQPDFLDAQREAATIARDLAARGEYAAALIDGVTGSGKTEVYFEAVAEAIRRGKQVLILMPEIALTAQFLDRFAERFGTRPAEWHSQLAPRKRARTWRAIADNEVKAIVGARSALFLPFADLGLIIVDEEHDQAYKQEDGIHYNARDMAIVRASIEKIPVLLVVGDAVGRNRSECAARALSPPAIAHALWRPASAAYRSDRPEDGRPAARTLHRAALGGSRADCARTRRAGACCSSTGAAMRRSPYAAPAGIASLVRIAMPGWSITDSSGGWSAIIAASACRCRRRVRNARKPRRWRRSARASSGWRRKCTTLFPGKRSIILSSDLVESVERLRAELDEVAEGQFDIVIGTQLVAKGHHFPKLNLVGIVDADLGLANGDPRAAERTFQLLHQVAGRAGREEGRGYGFLQTHQPEHPVMRALISGDREAFYAKEIDERERGAYPPFGRLAALIVSGGDRHEAESYARKIAATAPLDDAVRVLGPAEAPLALVRGRYRFRLLVKSPRAYDLSGYLRGWLANAPKTRGTLKLEVDIDPQSFL